MATTMPAPKREASTGGGPPGKEEAVRKKVVLRGFIRRAQDGSGYEGICLTLNLPVRGRTLEDTEVKLRELTIAYLRDAARDGKLDEFVPRRAPLSYYAAYYWYSLLAAFHAITDFKLFVESAPNCTAHA